MTRVDRVKAKGYLDPRYQDAPVLLSPLRLSLFFEHAPEVGHMCELFFDNSVPWRPGSSRNCEVEFLEPEIGIDWRFDQRAFLGSPRHPSFRLQRLSS